MTLARLDDLASLRARLAASSVEAGLGLVPVAIRPGHLRARLPLDPSCFRSDGELGIAVVAVAADCGFGVAASSKRTRAGGGSTVELRLDRAGPVSPGARELRVEGWALQVGEASGSGRVEIRDDTGSLVAHGVGVMYFDAPATGREGQRVNQASGAFDPRTVLVRPASDDGAVAIALLSEEAHNGNGTMHGGVLTALADLAQEHFRDRHGSTRSVSLTAEFLRPAFAGSGALTCHSAFVRRGRTFWTVLTELRRPDGVPVVRATGTSIATAG